MEKEPRVSFGAELSEKSAGWQEKDARTLLELVEALKALDGDYDFAHKHDIFSLPEDDGFRRTIKSMIDGSEKDLMAVYHGLGDLVPNVDFANEWFTDCLNEVRLVVRAIEQKFSKK